MADRQGPIRSMEVFLVDRVEVEAVLLDLGWRLDGDSWVSHGRGWTATIFGPVAVEARLVPRAVTDRQVGVVWKVEARCEGGEAGSPRVSRALRAIARVGHGVVVDGDEVWNAGSARRLLPVPVKNETEFLTMSWWTEGGRLSGAGAEALVDALAEVLPEALPYKWATLFAGWERGDPDDLAQVIGLGGVVTFEVRAPFTEFEIHRCSGPGNEGGVRQTNLWGLAIEVAGSVMAQRGWGRYLPRVFRVISETIVPFYGEARIQQAEYRRGVRHIEQPPPVMAQHWYGFPRSVPLAMVVGPPYRERWQQPGGEDVESLLFYTSDHWPEPPTGGVPQAPESFLQEHDIGWKSVAPRFPGMGPGITGSHPSRQPDFWPFASVEVAPVLAPGWARRRPGPESVPERRFEWPAVELGSLPPGSYFERARPPEWDPEHAGRTVRPDLTGSNWEQWSDSLYRSIVADTERRPTPNEVPNGAETSAATLNALLRDVVGPELRSLGMKGSGSRFYIERSGHRAGVAFQRSAHNRKGFAEFTVNLEGLSPHWHRIGEVLPELDDVWWVLPAGASTDLLERDLLESLREYALVAIQAALEEPPPPPGLMYVFGPPGLSEVRPIWQIYPAPPTLDQLYEDAVHSNPGHSPAERAVVISQFLMRAGPDRRCAPILLDNLANEADSFPRAIAAVRLAFTDVDPLAIKPALTDSAHSDPDRSVRVSARYALRLLEKRQHGARPPLGTRRTTGGR